MSRLRIYVFAIIASSWCIVLAECVNSFGFQNTGSGAVQHASGASCLWVDAPANGSNKEICSAGFCHAKVGSYKTSGSFRLTTCNKHFSLVRGYPQDSCVDGEWSSSGHQCVQCGKSPYSFSPLTPLISLGQRSGDGDFPWMVGLYIRNDKKHWTHLCGGTLISPFLVLTAAHCLNPSGRRLKEEDIEVGIGKLSSNYYDNEPGSSILKVVEFVRSDQYIGVDRNYDMDIALLVLERSVPVTSRVMPACIDWDNTSPPADDDLGVVAGWGLNEENTASPFLKWTFQKYVSSGSCRRLLTATDLKFLVPDKFCALDVNGGKANQGDSGGGLTIVRDGAHFVYGIVSTKLLKDERKMRLYTNVLDEKHLTWVRQQWRQLNNQRGNSSGRCSGNEDCAADRACVNQRCTNPCTGACTEGFVCEVRGHTPTCSQGSKGGTECSSGRDCQDGKTCVSGKCATPCNKNACDGELFCKDSVCFNPGHVLRVNTPDADFQYDFFPVPSGSIIRFKVKAWSAAHFMLSQDENPEGSQPYYEIVLGGWANVKSTIRRDRTKGERTVARSTDFLSENEFRGFWIKYENGNIAVGRENEERPFMAWTDPSPFRINYLGVNTGFGATGEWILYGVGCSSNGECSNGKGCISGRCANPCNNACSEDMFCEAETHNAVCSYPGKVTRVSTPDADFQYIYYPVPSGSIVKFKLKAWSAAHVMLSEIENPEGPQSYYEIVLGGWANVKSTIRRIRTQGERTVARSTGFLSDSEFRGFWIKFEDGNIAVGRESEKQPFMAWSDPSPFKIKYFGVNTGFGATGDWILYMNDDLISMKTTF